MKKIDVKIKVNDEGLLPEYKSVGASGMDLMAAADTIIEPKQVGLVPTGIFLEIPYGFEAQIRPRSGLALRHGITVLNTPGTIDSDYRGEIKVILINFSDEKFIIKKGDRIAQMVFSEVVRAEFDIVDKIADTDRGSGGFGSTGIR